MRVKPFATFAASAILVLLSDCGGGGGGEPPLNPCTAITSALLISKVWNSNGVTSQIVSGKVGVPLKATPTITTNPPVSEACNALVTFNTNPSRPLPAGLSLDSKTGIISGTPTEAIDSGGVPAYVTIVFPGFRPTDVLTGIRISN
jgi:hypothetical protein